jgi:hypothetical protein
MKKPKKGHTNVILHICEGCHHESYHNEFRHTMRSHRFKQSFKFWCRSVFMFLSYQGPNLRASHGKGIWPLPHCHTPWHVITFQRWHDTFSRESYRAKATYGFRLRSRPVTNFWPEMMSARNSTVFELFVTKNPFEMLHRFNSVKERCIQLASRFFLMKLTFPVTWLRKITVTIIVT